MLPGEKCFARCFFYSEFRFNKVKFIRSEGTQQKQKAADLQYYLLNKKTVWSKRQKQPARIHRFTTPKKLSSPTLLIHKANNGETQVK